MQIVCGGLNSGMEGPGGSYFRKYMYIDVEIFWTKLSEWMVTH